MPAQRAAKSPVTTPAKKVAPIAKKAAKKVAEPAAKKAARAPAGTARTAPRATSPSGQESKASLEIGARAPDFSLPGDDGQTHSLAALRGKRVVLYFYPRDSTPGCTVEACDFRDRNAAFAKAGVVVLGVSGDDLKSHARFRGKQNLNFPLLADQDHAVARAYGAFGAKTMAGRKFEGIIRSTFLIGADGRIAAVWQPVRVPGHAEAVLAAAAAR